MQKRGRRQGVLEFAELSHFGNLHVASVTFTLSSGTSRVTKNAPWNMPPATARSAPSRQPKR
jgi:hypothetical protein